MVRRTTALIVVLLLAMNGRALADDGSFDDPDDSSGRLDIRRVSHTNSDDSVTYRIDFEDQLRLEDVDLISWGFDFTDDGNPADACILLQRIGSLRVLRGAFYPECGPEVWSTNDARVEGSALEITFSLLDLVEGGGLRPGEPYSYRVSVRDHDQVEDSAPDDALVEHTDIPEVTPRPGSADTLLGNAGEGTRLPGRSHGETDAGGDPDDGTQARTAESAEEADGPLDGGPLAGVPVIGDLCTGSMCFALGLGIPVVAAIVGWFVVTTLRRRRSSGPPGDAPRVPPDDLPYSEGSDLGSRSSPRNL